MFCGLHFRRRRPRGHRVTNASRGGGEPLAGAAPEGVGVSVGRTSKGVTIFRAYGHKIVVRLRVHHCGAGGGGFIDQKPITRLAFAGQLIHRVVEEVRIVLTCARGLGFLKAEVWGRTCLKNVLPTEVATKIGALLPRHSLGAVAPRLQHVRRDGVGVHLHPGGEDPDIRRHALLAEKLGQLAVQQRQSVDRLVDNLCDR